MSCFVILIVFSVVPFGKFLPSRNGMVLSMAWLLPAWRLVGQSFESVFSVKVAFTVAGRECAEDFRAARFRGHLGARTLLSLIGSTSRCEVSVPWPPRQHYFGSLASLFLICFQSWISRLSSWIPMSCDAPIAWSCAVFL